MSGDLIFHGQQENQILPRLPAALTIGISVEINRFAAGDGCMNLYFHSRVWLKPSDFVFYYLG